MNQDGNRDDHLLAMDAKNSMVNLEISKPNPDNVSSEFVNGKPTDYLDGLTLTRAALCHANRLEEVVVGLSIKDSHGVSYCTNVDLLQLAMPSQIHLTNYSPALLDATQVISSPLSRTTKKKKKKRKKLACVAGLPSNNSSPMIVDRRPVAVVADLSRGKKQCMSFCNSFDKETIKVAAGSQRCHAL